MITQEYRINRTRYPQAELKPYLGGWVAFSADGCRIVAGADTVERLEEKLARMGTAAQGVVLEWLAGPEDDSLLGGGDLM